MRLRLGLLLTIVALSPFRFADAQGPHWISGKSVEKTLSIDEAVQSATLKLAADFCTVVVELNGRRALTVEPYSPTNEIDVTSFLQRGENKIRISTAAVAGPSAVAMSLTLVDRHGNTKSILTDGTWQNATSHGEVRPELWGLGRKSAAISPLDNYEQWQQAKGGGSGRQPQFWTAPGFEVTQVREATADEGSWIALAFDAQGRATISREDVGLLRMTLADDHKSVAKVEPVDVALPECRGLVYQDGVLYANANNAKALYRLRITEDARAVDLEKLREFPGGVGHGRNDLAIGPDGLIYSIHGDSVQAPGQPILDRTSPLRESRKDKPQAEAYVVRAEKNGKGWELFATGLRNPYGIAFNPAGDLFTYDADNEFDMGTPWYRTTRIVQIVSGGDYGYRISKGWPPNYPDRPDNSLPTIDVGRGSPTSVMFGTNLKFPAPYREALYVLDWAYGRVLAVHLAPRGAGYRAALELFMQGKPLNVTDVAAGPDGAMWLITGGRKTQSALYRVAYVDTAPPPVQESEHELAAAEFSRGMRALRLELEELHGRENPEAIGKAIGHLHSADPRIRHASRIAIEQQPRQAILKMIENAGPTNWEALMTLARAGEPALAARLVDRLLATPTSELDLSARFVLVFLYRECHSLAPEAVQKQQPEIHKQLAAIWPVPSQGPVVCPYGDSAELRRRLALLLADLHDPSIVDRVANSLLASSVQEDRLQGIVALRNTRQGWNNETRRTYFTALKDASRVVGGEGMPGFLDRLRGEAMATLTPDEREMLGDLLSPKIEDEPIPPARPKVKEWSLEDLPALTGEDSPKGSAKRGAKIFQDALCARCHKAGLVGPAVGPDLTFVARRFSPRDMLESIIEPSRSVAENYRNVMLVTESGQVHVGRLLSEGDFRSEKLRVNIDPLRPGQYVEIDKKDIARQQMQETSPMPKGLLDSFTREEIADLLQFLEEGAR